MGGHVASNNLINHSVVVFVKNVKANCDNMRVSSLALVLGQICCMLRLTFEDVLVAEAAVGGDGLYVLGEAKGRWFPLLRAHLCARSCTSDAQTQTQFSTSHVTFTASFF